MTPTELYDTFYGFMESGDEAGARSFLSEHLGEFPEATRNELISAFLTEAISEEAEVVRARAEIGKEALETVAEIQGAKKEIENQNRIIQLREQLGAK
ncbi:MAG: hypothetical protein AAB665_04215 [Patescibacteria group bacterium]